MESFMGQLILDDEIDYEAAKECLEERIRSFVGEYVYNCCPKEYRQSDEWKGYDFEEIELSILNFPEVTFENSPQRVEIKLIKEK